jgi:hypothetical protein
MGEDARGEIGKERFKFKILLEFPWDICRNQQDHMMPLRVCHQPSSLPHPLLSVPGYRAAALVKRSS